jgi:hypothetical protein
MFCAAAIVFMMDASPSINADQWNLMIEGHARAVTSEQVLEVIERDGLAVRAAAFAEWEHPLLEWRVLRTRIEAAEWAADLLALERPDDSYTRIGHALTWATSELASAPCGDLQVIDLVTDGEPTGEAETATGTARDKAHEAGVRINALAVGRDGSLGEFLRDNAATPGGFVLQVDTFNEVGRALLRKVRMELGLAPGDFDG